METFVTAYALVLLGLMLFVARMSLQHQRLKRAIRSLQQERHTEEAATIALRLVTPDGQLDEDDEPLRKAA